MHPGNLVVKNIRFMTDSNPYPKHTSAADVNAEWDQYDKQMKKMGAARYMELHQAAHDRYVKMIGN